MSVDPTVIAAWAGTLLSAKIFTGGIRRDAGISPTWIGVRHSEFNVDRIYVGLLVVLAAVVHLVGVQVSLAIAAATRLLPLVGARALVAPNHYFLEGATALVLWRLFREPGALAAVVQVIVVSVWIYAALQKLYHRQFLYGAIFHTLIEVPVSAGRVATVAPRVQGYFGRLDDEACVLCRWLAIGALALELAAPLLAAVGIGQWWGPIPLVIGSIAIGKVSRETSFMITNWSLALCFAIPFDSHAFAAALRDPVVLPVLAYFLCWPPLHALATRALNISTWKLGGWGMYATVLSRIFVIDRHGRLVSPGPGTDPLVMTLLDAFGACGVVWLREYARRVFLRWYQDAAGIRGFVFNWYRFDGDRYWSQCVVVENAPVAPRVVFCLDARERIEAFDRHVAELAAKSVATV